MKPSRVEIHIDELVLHGFAPGDRHRIAEGLRVELERLIATQGVPASLGRRGVRAEVEGGQFAAQPTARAESTGAQAAQSVYRGLCK